MRIISKKKDYYDHISMYGTDDRCVFMRSEEEFRFDLNIRASIVLSFSLRKDVQVSEIWIIPFAVFFCGSLHRAVCVKEGKNLQYFYRVEDFNTYLREKTVLFDHAKRHQHEKLVRIEFDDVFWNSSYLRETPLISAEVFSDDRITAPIAVFRAIANGIDLPLSSPSRRSYSTRRVSTCVNPSFLGEIGFYQIKSPEEAFTELYNWHLTRGEKPIEIISDKSKIIKAGFDTKTSFRGKCR